MKIKISPEYWRRISEGKLYVGSLLRLVPEVDAASHCITRMFFQNANSSWPENIVVHCKLVSVDGVSSERAGGQIIMRWPLTENTQSWMLSSENELRPQDIVAEPALTLNWQQGHLEAARRLYPKRRVNFEYFDLSDEDAGEDYCGKAFIRALELKRADDATYRVDVLLNTHHRNVCVIPTDVPMKVIQL